MKPFQSDRFSCSISAHAEVGPCLEYATFSIRRFNIIVICPRCLIQSYSSLGVAAPKHFRAWKATANRTDFAARFISASHTSYLVCSFRAKVALEREDKVCKPACAWLPASAAPTPGVHAVLAQFIHSPPRFSVILMQSSACMK